MNPANDSTASQSSDITTAPHPRRSLETDESKRSVRPRLMPVPTTSLSRICGSTTLSLNTSQRTGQISLGNIQSMMQPEICHDTAQHDTAQIDKQLTAWVNAGSKSERNDRTSVKNKIMNAAPTLGFPNQILILLDLDLSEHKQLTSLPENLIVSGDLSLAGCSKLTVLPDGCLKSGPKMDDTKRVVDLTGTGISQIDDLMFRSLQEVDLIHPAAIEKILDAYLFEGGDAEARDRVAFKALIMKSEPCMIGDGKIAVGSIDINSGCYAFNNLTAIPSCIGEIRGNVDFSFSALMSLPDNLVVLGDLNLNECDFLTAINGLTVEGGCSAQACKRLTNMGDVWSGEDLDLTDCEQLVSLPENLTVHGNLVIKRCLNLIGLPSHWHVGGDLDASESGLASLPKNKFEVGGDIFFNQCRRLSILPDWIITLGALSDGSARTIDLTGTGLSHHFLEQLLEAEAPGLQFEIDDEGVVYDCLLDAVNDWVQAGAADHLSPNDWGLDQRETDELVTFLSELHETAEAKNRHSKNQLQVRVAAFLVEMQNNSSDFRAAAMERISDGLSSCHDRVIAIMNNIEMLTRIQNARNSENPRVALTQLAKSLLALEVVHQHAARKCQRLASAIELDHDSEVDSADGYDESIEVYLAFEIKLKDDLALPVSTQNMLFEDEIPLTNNELAEAKAEALAVIAHEENITQYLNQWEPWQQLNRSEEADSLDWNTLPIAENYFNPNDSCVISAIEFKDIARPVCIGKTLYDHSALLKHWVEKGTDPATNQAFSLSQLRRVVSL